MSALTTPVRLRLLIALVGVRLGITAPIVRPNAVEYPMRLRVLPPVTRPRVVEVI